MKKLTSLESYNKNLENIEYLRWGGIRFYIFLSILCIIINAYLISIDSDYKSYFLSLTIISIYLIGNRIGYREGYMDGHDFCENERKNINLDN